MHENKETLLTNCTNWKDGNFVQALAQLSGMAINLARYTKGLKSSIDIMKTMREVQTRRTPYEGVPVSVSSDELGM